MYLTNCKVSNVLTLSTIGLFTLKDVQSMVDEITKMLEFNHPHVLSLIGVCLDTGPGVSMVMPFMANGSLKDYLKRERSNFEITDQNSDKVFNEQKSKQYSLDFGIIC